MSIKTRLLLAISALVLVGFLASGFLTVNRTRAGMIRRIDQSLVSSPVRPLRPRVGALDREGGRQATAMLLVDVNGTVLNSWPSGYPDHPDPLPDLGGMTPAQLTRRTGRIFTTRAVDDSSLRYRVLLRSAPGTGFLAVAAPMDDVDATTRSLLVGITVRSLVILALLLIVVWLVIRRGLQPIDDMIASAGQIAAGDLAHRIEHEDDATEVGQLGLALNRMLAQIESSFAAKEASEQQLRQFVADASHELKTPLTSILGYAELYRSGAATTPAGIERVMSRIESEGVRMGTLVDDLLLLARLDQGREPDRAELDLGLLAAEAVAAARAVEPDRSISFDREASVWVLGDADQLRQVIDNLLSNARQHIGPGVAVRVSVASTGDDVVLSVADDGPGMTSDAAARAFDRFYRADSSRARSSGGSGLGLSIVASIIAAHGGTVTLDTAPGKGATFRVSLARCAPPAGLDA